MFNNRQILGLLLIVSTLIRLFLGNSIQLGNDEVYYWTYAQYPDWSHFDHPPMVGFFEQLFTLNLHYVSEFALRLGFIISGTFSTLLVYLIGKEIKNERAGLLASILYNTSIYGFVISGLFIMPDGPLVLFWMTSLYFFIRSENEAVPRKENLYLGISLLCVALAIYSKYQGVYLLLGYGLYWFFCRRGQLKNPILYVNLLFTALVLLIIFYWNFHNNFTGVIYHSDRVTLFSLDFNFDAFIREVVGQVLYNNPYNYILIIAALVAFNKRKFVGIGYFRLLLFVSIPLIATTIFFSLYRDTLPHWSGVSFLTLSVLSGAYLSEKDSIRSLKVNLILIFCLMLGATGVVNRGWIIDSRLGSKEKLKLGKNDPTLDMYGWDQFKAAFEELLEEKPDLKDLPIVSNKWYPGSHLFYYVARPLNKELYVLGDFKDMHKYYLINQTMSPLVAGQEGIYITYTHNFKDPDITMSDYFERAELLKEFPVVRSGNIVEYGMIYLLQGYKNTNLELPDKEK